MRLLMATIGLAAALGTGAATGIVATEDEEPAPSGPPAVGDPSVPQEAEDRGVGEEFPTRTEAEEANVALGFGDVQGYYVAQRGQFQGIDDFLGPANGDWLLVSAFRTDEGAQEFADLAAAVGAPALVTGRVHNEGDLYVGLGQERAPDGSGPLRGPIPGVTLR
jgi:hypothetical protein